MNTLDIKVVYDDDSKETAELYVDLKLEDDTFEFLLDTGCAQSSLNFDDFTKKYRLLGTDTSSGVFTTAEYDLVSINKLKIGSIVKENLTLRRVQEGGRNNKLLGMDILRDYSVLFSFEKNKLFLSPDLSISTKNEFHVDQGYVPYLTLNQKRNPFVVAWDTGSSVTVIDSNFIEKHRDMFNFLGFEIGYDSTGSELKTEMYLLSSLEIGEFSFKPIKVAAVDLSHVNKSTDVKMDGILGYNVLNQANWYFDFPNKMWCIVNLNT